VLVQRNAMYRDAEKQSLGEFLRAESENAATCVIAQGDSR
jgi:hypothetical protein